ncbi:hypothetical protein [Novosphingobium sp. AAP1]|uniref:hypothetical protein n=1 Tax=Novosphingobium sp. AAP1 TaxID=1523413 RepID=UPI0018D08583|nr:hypothetical protein [Novosphingobium sp. AAP1]
MDRSPLIHRQGWRGAAMGTLVALAAIVAAVLSGGAGHGSYVAARALFPFSMLLTLLERSIGPIEIGVGLAQFPLYGTLIGSAIATNNYRAVGVAAAAHLAAGLACFSGILSAFA